MTLKALNLFIVTVYRTKEHASLWVSFESIKKSLELGGDRKVPKIIFRRTCSCSLPLIMNLVFTMKIFMSYKLIFYHEILSINNTESFFK
jgi:hypothetical protein